MALVPETGSFLRPYADHASTEPATLTLEERLHNISGQLSACLSLLEAFQNSEKAAAAPARDVPPSGVMATAELLDNQSRRLGDIIQSITQRIGRM